MYQSKNVKMFYFILVKVFNIISSIYLIFNWCLSCCSRLYHNLVYKLFLDAVQKKKPENSVVIFLKMSFKCFVYMMLELHTGGSSHQIGAGSADQRNKLLQLNIDSVCEYIFLWFVYVFMTYSYVVHVVAVAQVEVANEVAAVVLRITVGCRHTHWTHLEGARGNTEILSVLQSALLSDLKLKCVVLKW